jgi:phage shock protein A
MGIFSRIFKIGEAHANKAIDSLEKPEVMLEQAIRDKDKQIREARKAVQGVIATERQTKFQLNKEQESKRTWEAKAEAALRAGKEDLAVKALNRASEHEQKAQSMETAWTSQRQSVDALKSDINKMEDELKEFKRNKDFIIAQSKTAQVKKDIYEAKAKVTEKNSADDLMARLKAKVERQSFEADAAQEMAESMSDSDSLEQEFESLDSTTVDAGVADKLAALKARVKSA